MGFLARMQKLSDDKKRIFALVFAGVLTVTIAVSWYFFQYAPKGNPFVSSSKPLDTQGIQDSLDQLGGQINQAGGQIASGTQLIGQLIQNAQAQNSTTSATTTTIGSTTTQSLK